MLKSYIFLLTIKRDYLINNVFTSNKKMFYKMVIYVIFILYYYDLYYLNQTCWFQKPLKVK